MQNWDFQETPVTQNLYTCVFARVCQREISVCPCVVAYVSVPVESKI